LSLNSTFGSQQTYLNQVLLLEENPDEDIPVKQPIIKATNSAIKYCSTFNENDTASE
jgi:hypothetical protein